MKHNDQRPAFPNVASMETCSGLTKLEFVSAMFLMGKIIRNDFTVESEGIDDAISMAISFLAETGQAKE